LLVIGGLLFWLASRENLWAVYLFPVFTGVGFGATYVSMPLTIGNYYGVGSFANLARVTNPINTIFQYSAPAVAGLMYDINHDYAMAVLVACIAGLIGTIMIFFCKPPVPDQTA
jgi:hypothetical protein